MVSPKDLVVLVADKNMEATFRGLLARYQAWGIRPLNFDIFVHPYKDPGCRIDGAFFLRNFCNQYHYGLIVYDREGSGSQESRETLEATSETELEQVGWGERCKVIVFDPELEIWVWNHSIHVPKALGWREDWGDIWHWLAQNEYIESGKTKPSSPKETMEVVLRKSKKPRSSSIYLQIATNSSLHGHTEPAFLKLKRLLSDWFRE